MIITKRVRESAQGAKSSTAPTPGIPTARESIEAVFASTRSYHHAFVESRIRRKNSHVYRLRRAGDPL
jgi:hypothetical protein